MTPPSTAMNLGNIRTYVGKEVGVSEWECIDQHRIEAFAGNTGDDQWIHVDPERAARESPYGATIAHGYLLLSLLAPTTLNIVFKPAQIRTTINYGVDRVRFISPVKAGARVRWEQIRASNPLIKNGFFRFGTLQPASQCTSSSHLATDACPQQSTYSYWKPWLAHR